MPTPNKIGIIGSGSWAIALSRVLVDNRVPIVWWIRSAERISFFQEHGFHRDYLPSAKFSEKEISEYIVLTDQIKEVFHHVDTILLVMPSAFLGNALAPLNKEDWKDKYIISAIKGLLGENCLQIQEYLSQHFLIDASRYMVITGPSHAEEMVACKPTFLTFVASDFADKRSLIANFSAPFIEQKMMTKVVASQYVGILKNVYAIAAGMTVELGLGDNFKSAFVANISRELWRLLSYLSPQEHIGIDDFFASNFLGDLLVTCYSEHSRNQRLGKSIAQGQSPMTIFSKTKMVAEGYFASGWINQLADASTQFAEDYPIIATTSQIIHGKIGIKQGLSQILQVMI